MWKNWTKNWQCIWSGAIANRCGLWVTTRLFNCSKKSWTWSDDHVRDPILATANGYQNRICWSYIRNDFLFLEMGYIYLHHRIFKNLELFIGQKKQLSIKNKIAVQIAFSLFNIARPTASDSAEAVAFVVPNGHAWPWSPAIPHSTDSLPQTASFSRYECCICCIFTFFLLLNYFLPRIVFHKNIAYIAQPYWLRQKIQHKCSTNTTFITLFLGKYHCINF